MPTSIMLYYLHYTISTLQYPLWALHNETERFHYQTIKQAAQDAVYEPCTNLSSTPLKKHIRSGVKAHADFLFVPVSFER